MRIRRWSIRWVVTDVGSFDFEIRPLRSVQGHHVGVIQSLFENANPSVHNKLCQLLILIGTLRDYGAKHITALAPFLYYGRKDRTTKEHDLIATRYMAQVFEAR